MNLAWMPADMRALVEQASEPQRAAACLFGEARSEPIQGIVAVANVIRNRARQPQRFGHSLSAVICAPWQFSMWHPKGGEGNYKRVLGLMRQFVEGKQITDLGARECIGIAQLMVGDYLRDNTKGSVHYHAVKMQPRPSWAMGHTPAVQIGGHVFYATVK